MLRMQEDKVAVIVATVTDDVRLFEVPKLRVVAMRFTETARARIVKVGMQHIALCLHAMLLCYLSNQSLCSMLSLG